MSANDCGCVNGDTSACRLHLPGGGLVSEWVARHPDGATEEEIAEVMGVSKQRIDQVQAEAFARIARWESVEPVKPTRVEEPNWEKGPPVRRRESRKELSRMLVLRRPEPKQRIAPREPKALLAIVAAIESGANTTTAIARHTGRTIRDVKKKIALMRKSGRLVVAGTAISAAGRQENVWAVATPAPNARLINWFGLDDSNSDAAQ